MNILIPRQTQPTYIHNIFNELTKKTRSSREEPRLKSDKRQKEYISPNKRCTGSTIIIKFEPRKTIRIAKKNGIFSKNDCIVRGAERTRKNQIGIALALLLHKEPKEAVDFRPYVPWKPCPYVYIS